MHLPRFYPILDTATALRHSVDPVRAATEILEAGAAILQFRHKAFLSRQAFEWLEQIAEAAQKTGAMLVVNDRADLARIFDAALHLGQDDLRPQAARAVVGLDAVMGYSTHNESQLREAADEPVNYVALGPIFDTATKVNPDPAVGVKELRRLRAMTSLPIVAIGGITRSNAHEALDCGADSVAVIGDLFGDADIRSRTKEWLTL
jgi:thiamine-phosphate pyrophosphorylase